MSCPLLVRLLCFYHCINVQQPSVVMAYPNYMLTRSNCWTELSTEEVIMNSHVVSVAESDDPQMQIQIINNSNNEEAEETLSKGFVLVGVRTTNPKTDQDYQYVLDVIDGECTLDGGGCDEHKRIGGRSKDVVKVLVATGAVCKLQAGWAAGHEKVRLTPVLEIGGTIEDEEEEEDEEEDEEESADSQDEEEMIHDEILEDPSEENDRSFEKKRPIDPSDRQKMAVHHEKKVIAMMKNKQHYMENLFHYSIGFDNVGISWSGYWRGALFLLVTPSLAIYLCLKLNERNAKKRRDL